MYIYIVKENFQSSYIVEEEDKRIQCQCPFMHESNLLILLKMYAHLLHAYALLNQTHQTVNKQVARNGIFCHMQKKEAVNLS
jgi:hypothetical protein